ncbi:MAG: hypothetical protein RI955_292 [Bacteroidota bacterium]
MKLFLNYFVMNQFRDECRHSSRRKGGPNGALGFTPIHFSINSKLLKE